jgi:hypothetical protein
VATAEETTPWSRYSFATTTREGGHATTKDFQKQWASSKPPLERHRDQYQYEYKPSTKIAAIYRTSKVHRHPSASRDRTPENPSSFINGVSSAAWFWHRRIVLRTTDISPQSPSAGEHHNAPTPSDARTNIVTAASVSAYISASGV